MTIKLIVRDKEKEIEGNLTVLRAMNQLGLSPESYLAVRDGELLTERDMIKDGEVVKFVSVISGG